MALYPGISIIGMALYPVISIGIHQILVLVPAELKLPLFCRENDCNAKITAIFVVNMDYLDNYRYFVLSHRKLWLSIFGSDREFSARLLRFSVR